MRQNRAFLTRFTATLLLLLGGAFAIHAALRGRSGLEPLGDLLLASYAINCLLAGAIVWSLYFFRRRLRTPIGFLFIGGCLLKFLVFFALIYPGFQADGDMSRPEFASFFIPYLLALLAETYFTAKMLRDLEKEDTR